MLASSLSRRARISTLSRRLNNLDQVALDTGRCVVDLLKFQESYQSLRGILSALPRDDRLPVQIVNQINAVLALWRGDQVIQGDDLSSYPEVDRWRLDLSQTLNQQREFLVRRLAEHYRTSGQLEMAMDFYIQLGRMNFKDCSAHVVVIEILKKFGRLQEALEYCDALEVIFEREYGAPLPEEIIKCCHEAQLLLQRNAHRVNVEWPVLSSMHLPLVGRTQALGQLRQAFFRGGVVLIQGKLGTGKSRLVQELYELLSPKPLLILATIREHEHVLPLAPMINALRQYIPEQIWLDIDRVWANQLTLLLPEIAAIRSDSTLSEGNQLPSASQHLFDALHQVLLLVAQRYGRVLFFLDDAQWADRQTLQALSYLLGQDFFDEHGLLIIATQTERSSPEIAEFVVQIQMHQPVEVIEVPGLNPDELRILIEQVLNQPASPEWIEQLYRETDGNPFIALEILQFVLENQVDANDFQAINQLPVPDSIQGLIRSHLNTFSEDARLILACAAVIESNITLSMLQDVSGLAQNAFLNALDPLIKTGYLRSNPEDGINAGMVFLSHEKVREIVVETATPAYLQILHQRVAQHLVRDSQSIERAAIIADHYLAGGDVVHAFDWLLKAGVHAWRLGAMVDANRAFQRAEDLLNQAPHDTFNAQHILRLYKHWWDFAYQSNQIDLLEEIGIKLHHVAKRENDVQLMGVSNLVLANAFFMHEDLDSGLMLIEAAIRDLETTGDAAWLLQALFHRAMIQWWMLDFEGNKQTAQRILEIVQNQKQDSQEMISIAFNGRRAICDNLYAVGEAKKAVETAEKVYHEFINELDTFDHLRADIMLSLAYYAAGRIDDCLHYARAGVEVVEKLDNAYLEELLLIIIARAEIIKGYLDQAYEHGSRALKFAVRDNKVQMIVAANTLLGDVFNVLHHLPQAMQYYRVAQMRQGFFSQSYYGLENNIHLVRLLTRTDQITEARELLQSILNTTEEKGIMGLQVQALLADGLLDIKEHSFDQAAEKLTRALRIAEEKGLTHEIIWAKFRLAFLAFSQQHYALAEQHLADIMEAVDYQQMPLMSLLALDFARQLSEHREISIDMAVLRENFQSMAEHLEAHTQSPVLKTEFLSVQRYWQENGHLS